MIIGKRKNGIPASEKIRIRPALEVLPEKQKINTRTGYTA